MLEVRREVRALRREHPGLTADLARLAGKDARRVLLVSLSNDPEQIRLEGILAKAIELHGGRVTLLVYRSGTPWSGALFGALGLHDRLYFEDHAPGGEVLDARLAERLERCRTLADYKAFEVDGARIGRQALSTVVRASREPTVDLDDAGGQAARSGTRSSTRSARCTSPIVRSTPSSPIACSPSSAATRASGRSRIARWRAACR